MKKNLTIISYISVCTLFVAFGLFSSFNKAKQTEAQFVSDPLCVAEHSTNTETVLSSNVFYFYEDNTMSDTISIGGQDLVIYTQHDEYPSAPDFSGVTLNTSTGALEGVGYFPYMESMVNFGGGIATIQVLTDPNMLALWGNIPAVIDLSNVTVSQSGGDYTLNGYGEHIITSGIYDVGFGYLDFDNVSLEENTNISEACKEELNIYAGNVSSGALQSSYSAECDYVTNLAWVSQNVTSCEASSGPWSSHLLGGSIPEEGTAVTDTISSVEHAQITCEGGYTGNDIIASVPLYCSQTNPCLVDPGSQACTCATTPEAPGCVGSLESFEIIEV